MSVYQLDHPAPEWNALLEIGQSIGCFGLLLSRIPKPTVDSTSIDGTAPGLEFAGHLNGSRL
jgi:hypothetical protein